MNQTTKNYKPLFFDHHIKGSNLATFKATTFFRKPLYLVSPTKLSRKSFYKRRHINNFLFYFNILSLWSKEYIFFKNLNKRNLLIGAQPQTYLAQNSLLFSKKPFYNYTQFQDVKVTTFNKTYLKYLSYSNWTTNYMFFKFTALPWLYVTSGHTWLDLKKQRVGQEDLVYQVINNQIILPKPLNYKPVPRSTNIFDTLHHLAMSTHLNVYRIFILTLYAKIRI